VDNNGLRDILFLDCEGSNGDPSFRMSLLGDADAANVAALSQSAKFPLGKGQEDRGIMEGNREAGRKAFMPRKPFDPPGGSSHRGNLAGGFFTPARGLTANAGGRWKSPGGPADSAHLAPTAQGRYFETEGLERIRT
jgi:hypothetical protein